MKCIGWIDSAVSSCKEPAFTTAEACMAAVKEAGETCQKIVSKIEECVETADASKKKCIKEVDKGKNQCIEEADEGSEECEGWKDEGWEECADWADEGWDECGEWADEGYSECGEWADQGYSKCCDWKPCKWFCDAMVWIASWVCQGWYWIASWVCKWAYWFANWVCKFAYWFANAVCQGWYWLEKMVCKTWAWIANKVCVAWAEGTKLVCKTVAAVSKGVCTAITIIGGIACNTPAVLSWFFCEGLGLIAKGLCHIFTLFYCMATNLARMARLLASPSQPRIKHVFVLMLENRSFDHMLGSISMSGTDAVTGASTTTVGIPPGTSRTDTNGAVVNMSTALFALPTVASDPPHEFEHIVQQLCGAGVQYKKGQPYPPIDTSGYAAAAVDPVTVMSSFVESSVPVLAALAKAYAVCDNWFASMPGPTWPNRFFMHAASSGGLDNSPNTSNLIHSTVFNGYRFANSSIFDRLEENCLGWEIFEGDETPQSFAISGMNHYALMGRFTDFEEFAEQINEPGYDKRYVFIEPNYGNLLSEPNYICGNSQHPIDDVTRGEKLIKNVYEALRRSPIWNQSALIITYDEHGGFFDHINPPPKEAPGDFIDPLHNKHGFDFTQLGPRVPSVIVSPLIPAGTIDHTLYDHTSILATVERLLGLAPLTKRDAAANDLLHLFSLTTPRTDMVTLPDAAQSGFRCTNDPVELGEVGTGLSTPAHDELGREMRAEDVPPSAWGFLEVAVRREAMRLPYRKRIRLINEYRDARSADAVLELMQRSKARLEAQRSVRRAARRRSTG